MSENEAQENSKELGDVIKNNGLEIAEVQQQLKAIAEELEGSRFNDKGQEAAEAVKEAADSGEDKEAVAKLKLQQLDVALAMASPAKQEAMIKLLGPANLKVTNMVFLKSKAETESKQAESEKNEAATSKDDDSSKDAKGAEDNKSKSAEAAPEDKKEEQSASKDKDGVPSDVVANPKSERAVEQSQQREI